MIDAGAALRYLLSPVQDSLGGGCQHQFIHYFRSFNSQCGTNINHDRNIPCFSHSPLLKECQYHINVFFTLSLSGNQCQCHLYVNVTHQVAFPPIIPITRTSSPRSCGSPRVNVSVTPVSVSQVHHVALLVTTSVVWRDMGLVGVWRDTRGLSAFTTRKLGTDLRGVLVNFTKRIYFSPKWINI